MSGIDSATVQYDEETKRGLVQQKQKTAMVAVQTKSGLRYDNTYCYVCRLADGRLRELTEYMDTELAKAALGAP